MKPLFGRYQRVHLVGIGGARMEGLARILRQMGCQVSGSDRAESAAVDGLRRDGFAVQVGHRREQAEGADLVVFSAAVPADNAELIEALHSGIDLVGGAELLGELTRGYLTVAVAGSHGKTTTASMVADILRQADLEPSVLIGGWRQGRAQAELKSSRFFVVEADEFQRSFLQLSPSLALVTNVDAEHLDCYGDLAGVEDAFCQYLSRMPFYGRCVLAGDGAVGSRVRESVTFPCSTYGLKAENDFRADGIESHSWGSSFEMEKGKERLGRIVLNVPGEHNLRNSLGAAALANVMGVDFEAIARGLAGFTGVARRYERRGEEGGVLVIDDYAHHPAELAVAIDTAKRSGRRVVAVFQPHLFSRTRDLCRDFARELCAADQVFLADVYPSREEPLPGVDGGMIAREMRERGYRDVVFVPQKEQLPDRVMQSCRSGDLVLTLGAGDIDGVSRALVDGLKQRSS